MSVQFTDHARQVLGQAFLYAGQSQSGAIGGEHILLAILQQNQTIARHILVQLGCPVGDMAQDLEKEIIRVTVPQPEAPHIANPDDIDPLFLQNMQAAAESLGHYYWGTEHLLLAAITPDSGPAAWVLHEYEVFPQVVRAAVVQSCPPSQPLPRQD